MWVGATGALSGNLATCTQTGLGRAFGGKRQSEALHLHGSVMVPVRQVTEPKSQCPALCPLEGRAGRGSEDKPPGQATTQQQGKEAKLCLRQSRAEVSLNRARMPTGQGGLRQPNPWAALPGTAEAMGGAILPPRGRAHVWGRQGQSSS